jgi:hypothetical protein
MILALLLLLLISFSFHLYFLIRFVVRLSKTDLKWFINTAITNIILAGLLSALALIMPGTVRSINFSLMMWMVSGYVMVMMLAVKINIVRSLMRRAKDPQYFHYSYFGKKVLHPEVISKGEVLVFFLTLPIFLFSGAYFIARLVQFYSK